MTGKEPKTPEDYLEFFSDTEWGLNIQAENELMKFGKKAIAGLTKVAFSGSYQARQRAIQLWGEMKAEETISILADYLK